MQCPGQDNRYWDGEAVFEIPCPHCGNVLEFFKDDSQRSCKKCGNKVLNPKIDFGCAAYCPHADQCLGSMPQELLVKQGNLFKDRLSVVIRKKLHSSPDRYKLVEKRAELAETICKEEQGNMAAVVTAALLVDIEGWKEILVELKAEDTLIATVENLFSSPSPKSDADLKTSNIFHDACLLAKKLEKDIPPSAQDLKTGTGKKLTNKL